MEQEHGGCGCGANGGAGHGSCQKPFTSMIVKVVLIGAVASVLGLAVVKDVVFGPIDDTIQVTGHIEVPMKADTAEVNLGVLTLTAPTSEEAIKATSNKMAAVQSALQEVGVTAENYQLTGYALNPRYKDAVVTDTQGKPTGAAPEIIGYTCSQQVTVRIPKINEDATMIDKVLLAVTKVGANQAGEVRLFVSDLEKAKQAARLAAIKDARNKAMAVADAADVRLKGVGSWTENMVSAPGSSTPAPGVYSYGSSAPGGTLATPVGAATLGAGNLVLAVEVSVTYYAHRK